jgi:hypothetical protein
VAALTMPLPPPRPVQFAALKGGMANLPAANEIRALEKPSPSDPTRVRTLVAPDADAKLQLRALFEAVSAGSVAAPASRSAPVRIATIRIRDAAPDAVVAAAPERTTTRFSARSPGDDLASARFTGSATRPASTGR